MACCGGKKKLMQALGVEENVQITTTLEAGVIKVQYIGRRVGAFSMFGPASKIEYRFARRNEPLVIDNRDLELFERRPDFLVLRGADPSNDAAVAPQASARPMTDAEVAAMGAARRASIAPDRPVTAPVQRIQPPVDTRGTTLPKIPGIAKP